MTRPEHARSGYSQSLERGLAILSAFTGRRSDLGVTDVATIVGLTTSTAHRYVSTLAQLNYLEQDSETRKYRLGPRVVDLGLAAINSMELREIAAPYLQELSDETGYTVNMAVLDGSEIVYVERCRSARAGQREIDLNLHVGARLPAYCTSMGKVLLANLAPRPQAELIDRLELARRGPNTLTNKKALLAELARVKKAGMAVNNEELSYGLRSIAVPVFGKDEKGVAAINLAVHRSMGTLPMSVVVSQFGPVLVRTAARISARMGGRRVP
jgi:IclR family transcriptional regulator, pca regulon regulatory protein